ncbi:MAG: GNAT family N-acetyltransferase [Betaproteobacteria bacterium]|nr:GNAT family N-acetyltransferase [Betaproteobacteria bacterium]
MKSFRYAIPIDSPNIAALINLAKTGDDGRAGWTNESQLLAGDRTSPAEVAELMLAPGGNFLLCENEGELVGCVYLSINGVEGYLGLLAVRPDLQAGGVGRSLIEEAERVARDLWRCTTMLMTVITSHRHELTAYYQRRGYVRTGRFKSLARQGAEANTKVAGLRLEWMSKMLADL